MKEIKKQYSIEDGRFFQVTTSKEEFQLTPAVMSRLVGNVWVKVPNAFKHDGMTIHLSVSPEFIMAATRLPGLVIKTSFGVNTKKHLVPTFYPGDSNYVDLTMKWEAPPTMNLVFVERIFIMKDVARPYQVEVCYLYAVSQDKLCYRLPLPNVHDDTSVCTNLQPEPWEDLQELFFSTLRNFMDSQWNTDLLTSAVKERCVKLFTWDSTGEPFEQIKTEDWIPHCMPSSPPYVGQTCLPPINQKS